MRAVDSFLVVGCMSIALGIVASSESEAASESSALLPSSDLSVSPVEAPEIVNQDEVPIPAEFEAPLLPSTPTGSADSYSEVYEKNPSDISERSFAVIDEDEEAFPFPSLPKAGDQFSANESATTVSPDPADAVADELQNAADESHLSEFPGDDVGKLDDGLIVLVPLDNNTIEALESNSGNSSVAIDAEGTGIHNSYSYPQSHGHHQQNHFHQSYVKPLKPSVVHRDPHAHYDHNDAVRTQDHDRHHQSHGHKLGYGEHPHSQYGSGHGHGYGHSRGSHAQFQPYHYSTHQVPECAHENRRHYNLTFCLEDHYYPTETIQWAIREARHSGQRILADVTYQSADNLVDGLTRTEEEGYTYSHYYGGTEKNNHHLDKYKPPYSGYSYSEEYYKKGGYVCPSDIFYGRPRRAMNTYGKWKVIVNLDYVPTHGHGHGSGHVARGGLGSTGSGHGHSNYHQQAYTQTLRLEQCIYPNAPCSYIDSHYYSRCLQKHNFVRLVAWTYEDGLHIDTFKMPIACSCHIQQPVHYYTPRPHTHHNVHHTSPPSYGHVHVQPPTNHHHSTVQVLSHHHHATGQSLSNLHHGTGQALTSLHQGKANLLAPFLG